MPTSGSIIIVNYGTGAHVSELTNNIADVCSRHDCDIIVKSNSEWDVDDLGKRHISTRIVGDKENIGFGAACNLAACASSAHWLIFVNPDVQVSAESLDHFFGFISALEQDSFVSPRTFDPVNKVEYAINPYPSIATLCASVWPPNLVSGKVRSDSGYFSGSFFAVPRSAFFSVGGFDERFFLYYEDTDLFRSLDSLPRVVCSSSSITHAQGGATSDKDLALRYSQYSHVLYINKWMNVPARYAYSALYVLLATAKFLILKARGDNRYQLWGKLLKYYIKSLYLLHSK